MRHHRWRRHDDGRTRAAARVVRPGQRQQRQLGPDERPHERRLEAAHRDMVATQREGVLGASAVGCRVLDVEAPRLPGHTPLDVMVGPDPALATGKRDRRVRHDLRCADRHRDGGPVPARRPHAHGMPHRRSGSGWRLDLHGTRRTPGRGVDRCHIRRVRPCANRVACRWPAGRRLVASAQRHSHVTDGPSRSCAWRGRSAR